MSGQSFAEMAWSAWAERRADHAEKEAEQTALTAAGFAEGVGMERDGCTGGAAWADGVVLEYRRRRWKGERQVTEGWFVLCPRCGARLSGKVCRSLADIGEVLAPEGAHACEKEGGG